MGMGNLGGLAINNGLSPIMGLLGAARGGQIDMAGLLNILKYQDANSAPVNAMPLSIMTQGHQNFGSNMQGAMGQMQSLLQGNAARVADARSQEAAMQLEREKRHDQNQKFTMLYDALFKPQAQQPGVQEHVSPILRLLGMGGGGGSSAARIATSAMAPMIPGLTYRPNV